MATKPTNGSKVTPTALTHSVLEIHKRSENPPHEGIFHLLKKWYQITPQSLKDNQDTPFRKPPKL